MISVGIRYLCGYAAATHLSRQRPEWPVHPGRIFLAMAAAHYETGANPTERTAVRWRGGSDASFLRWNDGDVGCSVQRRRLSPVRGVEFQAGHGQRANESSVKTAD